MTMTPRRRGGTAAITTIVAVLVLTAMPRAAHAQSRPRPTSSQDKTMPTTTMKDGLAMSATDADLRPTMQAFVATAIKGDAKALTAMISARMRGHAGADAVAAFTQGQIIPFFAASKGVGRSVTVTNTTDGFGQQGLAYYAWMVPANGDPRPFVMYVVVEDGRAVVANILVDKFVDGRHQ